MHCGGNSDTLHGVQTGQRRKTIWEMKASVCIWLRCVSNQFWHCRIQAGQRQAGWHRCKDRNRQDSVWHATEEHLDWPGPHLPCAIAAQLSVCLHDTTRLCVTLLIPTCHYQWWHVFQRVGCPNFLRILQHCRIAKQMRRPYRAGLFLQTRHWLLHSFAESNHWLSWRKWLARSGRRICVTTLYTSNVEIGCRLVMLADVVFDVVAPCIP